jgi:hypothetical protein
VRTAGSAGGPLAGGITAVWTGEGKFQLRFGVCDTGGADTGAAAVADGAVAATDGNSRLLFTRELPPPPPTWDASE